jgi:hypothetical protein
MRFFSCLVLVFLVPQIALAQRVKLNKGKPATRNYLAQISYTDVQGKVIIPVEIEGRTYSFLFDTGAPNLITHELSQEISSKRLNSITVRDANDNSQKMQVISLPSVGIGGVYFEGVPALVNNPGSNFILDCLGVDGIIGSNMMRRSVVHLDSRRSVFQISDDPDNFQISGLEAIELKLSDSQSSPHMWIGLEGKGEAREYVLIDTGMQGFYDMSVKNFEKLRDSNALGQSQSGIGVKSIGLFDSSEANKHYRVLIPSISIGSHEFKNVATVTMDADRSRIGSDLLNHGKVTLDYRNSKFYFEPFEKERDLSEKSLGFSPTIKDGEVVVGIVWEEGLEERLNYGDRILRVNGVDIAAMDPCELINKPSPFDSEETFIILFKDVESNAEFTIQLTKK